MSADPIAFASAFIIGWMYWDIRTILRQIERNTRPPKPDIKSFINRNTKGDK